MWFQGVVAIHSVHRKSFFASVICCIVLVVQSLLVMLSEVSSWFDNAESSSALVAASRVVFVPVFILHASDKSFRLFSVWTGFIC